jgi:hypothetical protein
VAIRVVPIKEIPTDVALQLAPYSAEEYRAALEFGINPVANTGYAAAIYLDEAPVMVLLVAWPTFIGPAYLQFLLCEGFSPFVARKLLPLWQGFHAKYSVMETAVEKSLRSHCRFAKFFGFSPTGRTFDFLGREYEVYEARP